MCGFFHVPAFRLIFLPRGGFAEQMKTKHTTRKFMHRRGRESLETPPGAPLAPRMGLRKIDPDMPKTAQNHCSSHALMTCIHASTLLESLGTPHAAHQWGDPLPASARCDRSPPPWLGSAAPPAQVIVDKSLSGSSCRALPATRRAACEGGMITDLLGRRHMRDRALPG